MKSKSYDLKRSSSDAAKANKSFDFGGLYKSTAETVQLLAKPKTIENLDKEKSFGTSTKSASNRGEESPNKKKGKTELLDLSHINIDGQRLMSGGSAGESRATSTPYANRKSQSAGTNRKTQSADTDWKKQGAKPKVKSIMKNSGSSVEETMTTSTASDSPVIKPKKRNKSVSFMLDDNEEIATKKTKSDESVTIDKKTKNKYKADDKKKQKKLKKTLQAEKENTADVNMKTDQADIGDRKKMKNKSKYVLDGAGDSTDGTTDSPEKKKRLKKFKKQKKAEETGEPYENDSNNNEENTEHKHKKLKKKKRVKSSEATEGEPASKLKKEIKPEVIAEDLENLNIGDNAHTLTNLLDEMTVVDKDKKKKNKLRRKKDKTKKPGSVSSSETPDLEKIEEGKEKIKWKKRKWNKDKKGEVDEDFLATSVIIDNLPIKIMCIYKKLLADHFGKLGLIKQIGIAEVYPTEEPKPVFTTTINFYSEAAALKALEEDNTSFEGSRIRVKRPLPPTETTLVVRSYAELTEQNLSSVFTSAGRIRSIRHLVKGKKALATAFIVFDGPEAVQRAINMAEDARIGGKKIHVSKFELRGAKRKQIKKSNPDSENEGDSEDSND